ncbi:MAG: hypothetical protein EAZ67_04520 [Cytophagales bacterium]|nr:MAG: hypothetical protein EAZ67_04520 [Cytophagales bacterium]
MLGYRFAGFVPAQNKKEMGFEQFLNIFTQLLSITGGRVEEALSWLTNLDNKYKLSSPNYGVGDFIEDLKKKGYIQESSKDGSLSYTPRTTQHIRQRALEEIFGKLKKAKGGEHKTPKSDKHGEANTDKRNFEFGDDTSQIDHTDSIRNAQINHGLSHFKLTEQDLTVNERENMSQTATVLLIDISHSMILYGEDRITPAKKVAMALAEMIKTKYPKDSLDVIAFGNDAKLIKVSELPYLEVGPYHTNTIAGMEMALDVLRKRKCPNKQIFMITDGKPTCMKIGIKYYKNSFGLDPKIINKTLNLASYARKLGVSVTTFMIASDPYLKQFVRDFTAAANGNAYYSDLNRLGKFVFEDFKNNRRKQF